MRQGDLLITMSGADKEKILVLPRLEGSVAAAIRHEPAQDLPESGAVGTLIREFNEEDAPRLRAMHRAQLAYHSPAQPICRPFHKLEIIDIPLERGVFECRIIWKRPIQLLG